MKNDQTKQTTIDTMLHVLIERQDDGYMLTARDFRDNTLLRRLYQEPVAAMAAAERILTKRSLV